jgi:hypothetical protein
MKKITRLIIILAALVGLVGFYIYQRNIYSRETLKLEILGPDETGLLQEIEYVVKYKNNGDTRLENPMLTFEFPQHAMASDGGNLRVIKNSEDLGGAIYPGEEKSFSFKARLLGKEGEALTAKANLTYQPKNLKARYSSDTTLTTVITKVPITFEFDLPSKIEDGRDFDFRLNYFSNVQSPLPDLRVVLAYPNGFEFINSVPVSLEKTEWEVGVLSRAQGGRIEIAGRISGEINEEKIFQGEIGAWQNGEFILLKEASESVVIINPSLYITQEINGSPQYTANPGEFLHYEISFKNVGSASLNNLSLIVKLEGKALDLTTLQVPQGTVSAGDNSIVFDWRKIDALQFLDAGEEGKVEFWVRLYDAWAIEGAQDKNPSIKASVFLGQIQQEFISKINSKLVVSQKAFFNDEIFGNGGYLPPRIGGETTYTLIWQAHNFYNDVSGVKVKAVLPSYVSLTGKIFPEEAASSFTFDSQSREIVWDVGDMKMSQGVEGTAAPNVSFQVSLVPTGSNLGQTPNSIGEARISGQDQWTVETIESVAPARNTTLPDDETVTDAEGVVR